MDGEVSIMLPPDEPLRAFMSIIFRCLMGTAPAAARDGRFGLITAPQPRLSFAASESSCLPGGAHARETCGERTCPWSSRIVTFATGLCLDWAGGSGRPPLPGSALRGNLADLQGMPSESTEISGQCAELLAEPPRISQALVWESSLPRHAELPGEEVASLPRLEWASPFFWEPADARAVAERVARLPLDAPSIRARSFSPLTASILSSIAFALPRPRLPERVAILHWNGFSSPQSPKMESKLRLGINKQARRAPIWAPISKSAITPTRPGTAAPVLYQNWSYARGPGVVARMPECQNARCQNARCQVPGAGNLIF